MSILEAVLIGYPIYCTLVTKDWNQYKSHQLIIQSHVFANFNQQTWDQSQNK